MPTPNELKYAPTHEWVTIDDEGIATIGISDFAQDQLGDIVFLELPETGTEVKAGNPYATVESVKTASDINSPVSGVVIEQNQKAIDEPESVNEDAYETWLFKVNATDPAEIDSLLTKDGYQDLIKDE